MCKSMAIDYVYVVSRAYVNEKGATRFVIYSVDIRSKQVCVRSETQK